MNQLEKDMDNVLRTGFRKLTTAKKPTWVEDLGLEGIELNGDKLIPFWVKDNEKIYGEPPSQRIESIIFQMTEQKDEKHSIQAVGQPEIKEVMMMEYLTEALIEKYRKLSSEARLMMLQKTDKRYVKTRPGRAGMTYTYVEGHYMHQAANLVFLFEWGSKISDIRATDTEVICIGSVWGMVNGKMIEKASIGQQDIKFRKDSKIPLCLGDDYKAAVTDMEKKGLSKFGLAVDVYRGDV